MGHFNGHRSLSYKNITYRVSTGRTAWIGNIDVGTP
jgi:hypothetical protein